MSPVKRNELALKNGRVIKVGIEDVRTKIQTLQYPAKLAEFHLPVKINITAVEKSGFI